MNASYTVEPDMPPRERHTLSAHEHRLATPEPTPPDWDRGPLSFLRCPRSTYVLALVFALLALWLRFDPTYGAKTLGVGDASKGHALAWFTDADGAFAWTGSPAQREAVSWLVLALGLGLVVLLKAGRTRGVLAVFLAALGAYDRLRPDSDVRAWLVTIAHRKAIDVHRRAGRAPVPLAEVPERPVGEDAFELADPELWRLVASLPDKQRGAVVYRHVAGLPYAQVADLLGCSAVAARRSAADGIARLRRHLTAETQEVQP